TSARVARPLRISDTYHPPRLEPLEPGAWVEQLAPEPPQSERHIRYRTSTQPLRLFRISDTLDPPRPG
ncbi:MAG TPA: hypothetical protein PLZ95_03740, partial [Bryobacteraceae bacterium]|nr:hypothetical protein [Bryobacteraceae bacterium]